MPFGLTNAPATFQRLMQDILGDLYLKEVTVYLDDIVAHTATLEEHFRLLREVFQRLCEAGLKLSPKRAAHESPEEESVEVTASDHGAEDGVGGKGREESDQGIGVHQADYSKQEAGMGQGEVSILPLDEVIRSSQTGMKLRRSERNRRPPDWYDHSNQILAIQTYNWLRDFPALWQDFSDQREETYQELLRKCQAKWCDSCGCQENVVSFVSIWCCFYQCIFVLFIFYLYCFLMLKSLLAYVSMCFTLSLSVFALRGRMLQCGIFW